MTVGQVTYVDAVRETLSLLLEADERVVLLGEDIGHGGGAFRATTGLIDRFGPERVRDTPISEAAFTGVAVGLALEGMRPIVEYQFADFLTSGFTQIVNVASKMYYRFGLSVPIVIRAPAGGGFSGGPFHSQNPEAWFLHAPGIKVACPAFVEDVPEILGAAVQDMNPVLVLEQKNLYTRVKGVFAPPSPAARLVGARLRHHGDDVTLVTYGAAVHIALEAAERCAADGIQADVIDLRILCPLDWETVIDSLQRSGKALVVHEAATPFSAGSEIAAHIAENAFELLDAPLRRIGAAFHPVPFSRPLEQGALPDADRIERAIRELAAF